MITVKIDIRKLVVSAVTLILMCSGSVCAQTESYIQKLTGVIKTGSSCRVRDEKFVNKQVWNMIKTNHKVQNMISLELRTDTAASFPNKPFTCELTGDIDYMDSSNTERTIPNIKLVVQYDTAKGKTYKGIAYYKFEGAHDIKFTVKTLTSKEIEIEKAGFLRIVTEILVDRDYKKRKGNNHSPIQVKSSDVLKNKKSAMSDFTTANTSADGYKMDINWIADDFEWGDHFDLEYTFYDQNSYLASEYFEPAVADESVMAGAFKNNATRVSLNEPNYSINLVFPKGFLLIRIRAYTYSMVDGDMDREEGEWHYYRSDTELAIYKVEEHFTPNPSNSDILLNWQYSASFAEDGKRKEVVSYFDGGNKSRQSVTLSSTDNNAIIGETVLDRQNRPVISILPVPVEENNLRYYPAFNRNLSGEVYSYANFSNSCVMTAEGMNPDFGSSKYYSPNNSWINEALTRDVPNANQFPFAVTELTKDQTGRIRRQGGVGEKFQIGTNHETTYYYGKPTQRELDRLFGSEAGSASHYSKNMVVDANGQVSVSYMDITGKTVATALAGDSPENLSELESKGTAQVNLVDELVRPQAIVRDADNLKLSFNTTIMVPVQGNYLFEYNFSGRSLELIFGWDPEKKLCADCYYDVKFSISNECGNSVWLGYNGQQYKEVYVPASFSNSNNYPNADTDCGTVVEGPITGLISAAFEKGEYRVSYELILSRKALEDYMVYLKQAGIAKTSTEFKKDYLRKIDLTGCFTDCRECEVQLGTLDVFKERIRKVLEEVDNITVTDDDLEWITTLYHHTLDKCGEYQQKNCSLNDGCADYRKMMLKDVTPGGQYMLFDEKTLLFRERGINAFLNGAKNDATTPPSVIITRNGVEQSVLLKDLKESELITYWDPQWAYLMLEYHPEYCLLKECQDQVDSKNRDKAMLQTDDEEKAASDFDWNPDDYGAFVSSEMELVGSTPFERQCIENEINRKLNTFIQVRVKSGGNFYPAQANSTNYTTINNVSLKQFIKFVVYCDNKPPANANGDFEYIDLDCIPEDPACDKPLEEWRLFRNLYIAIKQAAYRNPSCKTGPACGNCYIGVNVLSSLYEPKADPLYYPQLKDFIIEPTPDNLGLQVTYNKEELLNNRCDVYIYKFVEGTGGPVHVQTMPFQFEGAKTIVITGDADAVPDKIDLFFTEHIINNYHHNLDGTIPPTTMPLQSDFSVSVRGKNAPVLVQFNGKYPLLTKNNITTKIHRYSNINGAHYGTCEIQLNPLENQKVKKCFPQTRKNLNSITNYSFTSSAASCPEDARWPDYFQKTRRFYESSSSDDIHSILQTSNAGESLGNNTNVQDGYLQNAKDLSEGWLEKLSGCTHDDDPERKELLRDRLIAICVAGSDQLHPFGATSTKNNLPTSFGDRSFRDAIKWYLQTDETATCNALLIDFPPPYNSATPINDAVINQLSACGYALLIRFKNEWVAASPEYPTLNSYIRKNYDPNFYLTYEQVTELLDTYISGCPLKRPIRIPGLLSRCDDPATPACLKCDQLYNVEQNFQSEYPQFSVNAPNYYELLAAYINEQYQMNVAPSAVYDAVEKCKAASIYTSGCTTESQCTRVITALQNFYAVMPINDYTVKAYCQGTTCDSILPVFRTHLTTWLNLNLGWNRDYAFYATNYLSGCAAAYYQEPCALSKNAAPEFLIPSCECIADSITCCNDYAPFNTFRGLYPNPVDPRILAYFFELRKYTFCAPVNLPDISYQLPYNVLVNYFSNVVPDVIPYSDCVSDTLILSKKNQLKKDKGEEAGGKILIECETVISGSVWHDINGMSDGYVNNTGANIQDIPSGLQAYLVPNSTSLVQSIAPVNFLTGEYDFGWQPCASYKIIISSDTAQVGDPSPAASLPVGWSHTGQMQDTLPGNDGVNDGKLNITTYLLNQESGMFCHFGIKETVEPTEDDSTVTITGHVWNDINGMSDGFVNNTGAGNPDIPQGIYAYLFYQNYLTDGVVAISQVDELTGQYSFPDIDEADYLVRISNVVLNLGDPMPASILPGIWEHTGQHLGTSAGSDGVNDGTLYLAVGSSNVSDANFGIKEKTLTVANCSSNWTFTFAPVTGCGSIYTTVFAAQDFVLCSQPISPVYQSDPDACIKGVVSASLANAEYAYNEYIKDLMRDYREAYFAKCLSITPSLKMEGKQEEYHYTLYYYDQAGNLVKTIPPKGVVYLSDEEVDEVQRVREEDNADCFEKSKAPSFTNTSTHVVNVPPAFFPLHNDGPVTVEQWVKFTNTTNKQAIIDQFNEDANGKAGYYAYIENDKIYFSIYGRSKEKWAKKEIVWLYEEFLPDVTAHYYNTVDDNVIRYRDFRAVCNTENAVSTMSGANDGYHHIVFQYSGDPNGTQPVKIYINGILQTLHWTELSNGFADALENEPYDDIPSIDAVKYDLLAVQSPFTTASDAAALQIGAKARTINGILMNGVDGNIKQLRVYNAAPDAADLRRSSFDDCFIPASKEGLVLWLPLNREKTTGFVEDIQSGEPVAISADWGPLDETQYPAHKLPTYYSYNSLNQVVKQETPDAGISNFWYDRLGRLVISQNAEQHAPSGSDYENRYSYTKYDALGRINEVGEKLEGWYANAIDVTSPSILAGWYDEGIDRQITQTIYDEPYYDLGNSLIETEQLRHNNSRKRVSSILYKEDEFSQFKSGTHYVYDINGNVKKLYQQYKGGDAFIPIEITKSLEYDYDLVSGKVNRVWYQRGQDDQYLYDYQYDADNRIIKAQSGRDVLTLREDSKYKYYRHGPLGRTELGHLNDAVQGIDYAYTLQGWLKGINGLFLNEKDVSTGFDMGDDGKPGEAHANIPADVYGYTLGYFDGDYEPVNTRSGQHPISLKQFGNTMSSTSTGDPLYNGNIAYTSYANRVLGTNLKTHSYSYRYDQLNRLVLMNSHNPFTAVSGNDWNHSSVRQDYMESVAYDANGNIKTYDRNGSADHGGLDMDKLEYQYDEGLENNQLSRVRDLIGSAAYPNDLDNQASSAANYVYDRIGNLIKDAAGGNTNERINLIEWTVYGKIKSIEKANGTIIEYEYDASGNRITKMLKNGDDLKTTFYFRDASGNVMAVYEQPQRYDALVWKEQHLYGSSRLGVWNAGITIDGINPVPYDETQIGSRQYELTNHLGNVMATITDKKLLEQPNGGCQPGTFNDILDVEERETELIYKARLAINFLPGFESGEDDAFETQVDDNLSPCEPLPPAGSYYIAEVITANDYYPFGMSMPGREYNVGSGYRYGFNGKENDKDAGVGIQDYGMRIYDVRLGKFLSVDPLTKHYPMLTPYQFGSNSPISSIDLDGLEGLIATGMPGTDGRPIGMIITVQDASKINKRLIVSAFKAVFSEELPKKFIEHYSYGEGKSYALNKTEMVDVKSSPTGVEGITESDREKFQKLIKGAKKGSSIDLPSGYSIQGGATTAGTLGRFTIMLSGKIKIDDTDATKWSFAGAMLFFDIYDFKTSPVDNKDLQRSEWGDMQTKLAEKYLPGEGFIISSPAVVVKQTSSDESFDWYDGKAADGKQNRITNEMKENPKEAKKGINEAGKEN